MTQTAQHTPSSGLSFLEVLLVVAMLGLLLVGASTLLFALTRSYFSIETGPQLVRHVDGIIETIHYLATISAAPDSPPGRHFQWIASPVTQKPTIAFHVDSDVPLFVSKLKPLPSVRAYLEFDVEESQFWLVWFPDPAYTENKTEYQYTLLSPWAGDIEYGYYDATQKTWEFELASSDNRQNAAKRPNRVHLIFDREGQIVRRQLHFNSGGGRVLSY